MEEGKPLSAIPRLLILALVLLAFDTCRAWDSSWEKEVLAYLQAPSS